MISQYDYLITFLIKHQRASHEQLQSLQVSCIKNRQNFPRQLVTEALLSAEELLTLNQKVSPLPVVDLRSIEISSKLVNQTTEKLIRKHAMLPIAENNGRLSMAVSDPFDTTGLEIFKHLGNYTLVEPLIASARQIDVIIEEQFSGRLGFEDLLDNGTQNDGTNSQALEKMTQNLMGNQQTEEAPVVKYISEVLLDAIRTKVSDLHFEPYEDSYRVRFRKDGILREVSSPPIHIAKRITARLKVLAGMDIAEKRIPQDGHIELAVSQTKNVDLRVSTLPTLWGEKIALRILETDTQKLNIDELGMTDTQKALYLESIRHPQGLILVTGPTGSGKTLSLYSALNQLNNSSVNISTIEDPVEIAMKGINQVNINLKQGMTFASALRAFLRQDPDIIMVGEIRDLETAEIAIKAAQTGHLVFSTLHTNDAPQSLTRLANMGVAGYNIAASVRLIMAQRLLRVLCPHCKAVDEDWTQEQLLALGFTAAQIEALTLYKPKGCDYCRGQGYQGRVGIFQIIKITPTLSQMIMSGASSIELEKHCQKEGFWNLRESGLDKAQQGITSIAEVLRVTMD